MPKISSLSKFFMMAVLPLAFTHITAHAQASIWDGVYTKDQAARGKLSYSPACAKCHGEIMNGSGQPDQRPSPALAGDMFLFSWNNKPVAALWAYIKTTMPTDNPGILSDQQTSDVIAHMLSLTEIPTGAKPLPSDIGSLAGIMIKRSK
jgi:quinoprotein glucose dehydrogenase